MEVTTRESEGTRRDSRVVTSERGCWRLRSPGALGRWVRQPSDDGGHSPTAVVPVIVLPRQVGGGHEHEALVRAAVLEQDVDALLAGGLPGVGQRRVPVGVAGHDVHAVLPRQHSHVSVTVTGAGQRCGVGAGAGHRGDGPPGDRLQLAWGEGLTVQNPCYNLALRGILFRKKCAFCN